MTEGNTMNQPEPSENDATPEELEQHEREVEQSIAEHDIAIDSEALDQMSIAFIDVPSDPWLTEAETAEISEPDDGPTEREILDPEIEQAREELDAEEGDSFPEELFTPPAPAPPLQILVAASHGFTKAVIIQSVLGEWIQRHSARQIVVATSGAPEGGEALAAAFAQQMGAHIVSIRDEQIQRGMFTHAFGFFAGDTTGARATIDAAFQAGVPVTRIDMTESPAWGPWTSR